MSNWLLAVEGVDVGSMQYRMREIIIDQLLMLQFWGSCLLLLAWHGPMLPLP